MKLKIIIIVCAVLVGGVAGVFSGIKMAKQEIKVPPCPDCNCPPNVSIQQLDMSTIRKIKGDFMYSPNYDGTVIMNNCNDTIKK